MLGLDERMTDKQEGIESSLYVGYSVNSDSHDELMAI